ncbi:hypothetical protein VOLCADRAFT_107739 [Volvox carteri f. nagariensis]|uniref:Uncharacterized protein n=1 Tax=Volvox carteri f. nagariensis TaxID=3068 RepID=D8UFZ5_VOLCA|nr:uncharacterized protein VOLCADRAFT_107739 [Volvox carteri f. nagariensis]EFJ41339.1 hypothetical protein VOLCADRAFT_107739 [Volvox carteri f. nagariensis]|eukprot:XP_002957569.1 hypothetical protein VOLCADRAFT_107739 [Volvox carteri f. nagariensis]
MDTGYTMCFGSGFGFSFSRSFGSSGFDSRGHPDSTHQPGRASGEPLSAVLLSARARRSRARRQDDPPVLHPLQELKGPLRHRYNPPFGRHESPPSRPPIGPSWHPHMGPGVTGEAPNGAGPGPAPAAAATAAVGHSRCWLRVLLAGVAIRWRRRRGRGGGRWPLDSTIYIRKAICCQRWRCFLRPADFCFSFLCWEWCPCGCCACCDLRRSVCCAATWQFLVGVRVGGVLGSGYAAVTALSFGFAPHVVNPDTQFFALMIHLLVFWWLYFLCGIVGCCTSLDRQGILTYDPRQVDSNSNNNNMASGKLGVFPGPRVPGSQPALCHVPHHAGGAQQGRVEESAQQTGTIPPCGFWEVGGRLRVPALPVPIPRLTSPLPPSSSSSSSFCSPAGGGDGDGGVGVGGVGGAVNIFLSFLPLLWDWYIIYLAWSLIRKLQEQRKGIFRGRPAMDKQRKPSQLLELHIGHNLALSPPPDQVIVMLAATAGGGAAQSTAAFDANGPGHVTDTCSVQQAGGVDGLPAGVMTTPQQYGMERTSPPASASAGGDGGGGGGGGGWGSPWSEHSNVSSAVWNVADSSFSGACSVGGVGGVRHSSRRRRRQVIDSDGADGGDDADGDGDVNRPYHGWDRHQQQVQGDGEEQQQQRGPPPPPPPLLLAMPPAMATAVATEEDAHAHMYTRHTLPCQDGQQPQQPQQPPSPSQSPSPSPSPSLQQQQQQPYGAARQSPTQASPPPPATHRSRSSHSRRRIWPQDDNGDSSQGGVGDPPPSPGPPPAGGSVASPSGHNGPIERSISSLRSRRAASASTPAASTTATRVRVGSAPTPAAAAAGAVAGASGAAMEPSAATSSAADVAAVFEIRRRSTRPRGAPPDGVMTHGAAAGTTAAAALENEGEAAAAPWSRWRGVLGAGVLRFPGGSRPPRKTSGSEASYASAQPRNPPLPTLEPVMLSVPATATALFVQQLYSLVVRLIPPPPSDPAELSLQRTQDHLSRGSTPAREHQAHAQAATAPDPARSRTPTTAAAAQHPPAAATRAVPLDLAVGVPDPYVGLGHEEDTMSHAPPLSPVPGTAPRRRAAYAAPAPWSLGSPSADPRATPWGSPRLATRSTSLSAAAAAAAAGTRAAAAEVQVTEEVALGATALTVAVVTGGEEPLAGMFGESRGPALPYTRPAAAAAALAHSNKHWEENDTGVGPSTASGSPPVVGLDQAGIRSPESAGGGAVALSSSDDEERRQTAAAAAAEVKTTRGSSELLPPRNRPRMGSPASLLLPSGLTAMAVAARDGARIMYDAYVPYVGRAIHRSSVGAILWGSGKAGTTAEMGRDTAAPKAAVAVDIQVAQEAQEAKQWIH